MFEVEIKAYLNDSMQVEHLLQQLGAAFQKTIHQIDSYFQHPIRNFAQTDEALRIRISDHKSFLTYKGSKVDSLTKTREELEVEIQDPDKLHEILSNIGFSLVLKVVKTRKKYIFNDIKISIDSVQELGDFIEFELEVTKEEEIELARTRLFSLLEQIKIPIEKLERRSYLELIFLKMLVKL